MTKKLEAEKERRTKEELNLSQIGVTVENDVFVGPDDVAGPWAGSGTNIWAYREDIWGQGLSVASR